MRKLSTIRKIKNIIAIPNADRIEIAVVDGWHTVVQKNQFKVGDFCVYFEIDSLLPFTERFSIVKNIKKVNNEQFYFLKTALFLGQVSQGFVMTIDQLPEVKDFIKGKPEKYLDYDFSKLLGVSKFEPYDDLSLSTEALCHYPYYVSKSSEPRIQNCFDLLKVKYKDVLFYPTLKMDGASLTVCHINKPAYLLGKKTLRTFQDDENKHEQTWIGSHHLVFKNSDDIVNENVKKNAFFSAVEKYKLDEQLKNWSHKTGRNIAIQCELLGPKIANSHECFSSYDLRAFHIYLIDEARRSTFSEFIEIMKDFNCPTVLSYEPIKVFDVFNSVEELISFAVGPSENPNVQREGLVFRSDTIDEFGRPVSFKVISNEFLLKKKTHRINKMANKQKKIDNNKK